MTPPKKDQAAREHRPLTQEGFQAPSGRLQLAATRLSRWAPDGPRAPDRGRLGLQSWRLVRTTPRAGVRHRGRGKGHQGRSPGTHLDGPASGGTWKMASEPAQAPPPTPPLRPDGHPARLPSVLPPLGTDPPSGSTEARMRRGRGTGRAGHLSLLARPPRGCPPGAGRLRHSLFPPVAPRGPGRREVSRWWAIWGLDPLLTGRETRPGPSWPQVVYLWPETLSLASRVPGSHADV